MSIQNDPSLLWNAVLWGFSRRPGEGQRAQREEPSGDRPGLKCFEGRYIVQIRACCGWIAAEIPPHKTVHFKSIISRTYSQTLKCILGRGRMVGCIWCRNLQMSFQIFPSQSFTQAATWFMDGLAHTFMVSWKTICICQRFHAKSHCSGKHRLKYREDFWHFSFTR